MNDPNKPFEAEMDSAVASDASSLPSPFQTKPPQPT